MTVLLLGLVLFLGIHSARIVAEPARQRFIAARGENAWKGLYSVVSIIGFGLLVWGYGLARSQPVVVWSPPAAMRHASALLVLVAFVLLAAAYVPRNPIRAKLHHPMVLGVKTWALAHLLANGLLHQMIVFGAFLAWAALSFRAARGRDRAAGTVYPAGSMAAGLATGLAGAVAWGVFAFGLHGWLFGVRPFG